MKRARDESGERLDVGSAALWASAMVIGAMILSFVGRGGGAEARADVSEVGDLTVLTASASNDEDVLLVLDRREERLSVYGVENGRNVVRYQVENLSDLFSAASGGAGRRGR